MTGFHQRLSLTLVALLVAALFVVAWYRPPASTTAAPRAVLALAPSAPVTPKHPWTVVETHILPDLVPPPTPTSGMVVETFTRLGYDLQAVLAGGSDVPRVLLVSMPADLADIPETPARKALFLQAVLPLVLQVNDEIQADRNRLSDIRHRMQLGKRVSAADRLWLAVIADRYGVENGDIDELLRRIDVIPPSLALAQAAEESGWGSSRFVREGNALFGQWTFARDGHLVPLERDDDKDHRIKAFDSLIDSVRAYALNLNTHRAYRAFRAQRAQFRAEGAPLEGRKLAGHLTRYSQRGPEYVRTIRNLIAGNGLSALDDARLRDELPVSIPAI
jgi:Bax protein